MAVNREFMYIIGSAGPRPGGRTDERKGGRRADGRPDADGRKGGRMDGWTGGRDGRAGRADGQAEGAF